MIPNLTYMELLTYKIAEAVDLEERWHIFAKRTEATERKFKPALIKTFDKQERSVLSRMRGKPVPDTSDAKIYACVGDEVERFGETGVITQILDAPPAFDLEFDLDDPRNIGRLAPWVRERGRYFKKIVPIDDDVILLKASEEATAAAVSYVDELFGIATWQKVFATVATPFVTEAFAEAGQAAFTEIGLEASFNVTNARAREILRTRVFKFAKEVNETTQARLRTALAAGFDAGEGIPELSKRVAGVFDIAKSSRTDTIARTEIVGASNQGTHQGFIDSEIVETEIWIDSRDARVRTSPHNHAIDGEEVKLGERFSNGLLHPHDPGGAPGNVINCRCTTGAGKLKEAA